MGFSRQCMCTQVINSQKFSPKLSTLLLSEKTIRLVPERLYERVYGYFVAYSTDSSHNGLEPIYEVTERFIISLGHAPKIDIRGLSIYEHRVLLEKLRSELAEISNVILSHAREPLECCSSKVFNEDATFSGISFVFSKLGSPHRDLESLKMCHWIGCTVIRCYLDLSRIRNLSSGDASSEGHFFEIPRAIDRSRVRCW